MREHRDAIEASLRFHCSGLSLAALGAADLTWPDLAAILRWLPSTSPFKRVTEAEFAGWDVHAYQLANLHDLLAGANWQRANAGAKKASTQPKPAYRPRIETAEDVAKRERMKARERRHVAQVAEIRRQRGEV